MTEEVDEIRRLQEARSASALKNTLAVGFATFTTFATMASIAVSILALIASFLGYFLVQLRKNRLMIRKLQQAGLVGDTKNSCTWC